MGLGNPLVLAGTCVLGLGVLLHIVGIATPNWSTLSSIQIGPFKSCYGSICDDTVDSGVSVDLDATRAMLVIGLLLAIAALVFAVLVIVFTVMGKEVMKWFPLGALGGAVSGFIFIIIGVIIWAAGVHETLILSSATLILSLSWSFAMSIVGGLLVLVGGILAFVGGKNTAPL